MRIIPAWPESFPSDIPVSLFDWKGAGWYYRVTLINMIRTFWARFGWGTVPLIGSKPYRLLAVLTLIGMAGAGWAVWRRRRALPWEIILFSSLVLLGLWFPAIIRGVGSIFGYPYIPSARYAYPVILSTQLVLIGGWEEILRLMGRWLRIAVNVQHIVTIFFFVVLDVLSIITIVRFFY